MKKTVLMAAGAVVAAGFSAVSAQAIDMSLYGQVNKGVMVYDDSRDTEFNVVDNSMSSTRMGLKGSQALDNGLTASALLEYEMVSNASGVDSGTPASAAGLTQNAAGNIASTPTSNNASFVERHARVGLAGSWGAVFVGKTSTATDFTMEQDLAGVEDVMGANSVERIGGGLKFRNQSGSTITGSTSTTVDGHFIDMDGGLAQVVRYDSPIYAGFQGRASVAQGGDIDLSALYSGKVADLDVKGAVGYNFNNDAATVGSNRVQGTFTSSLSAKHASGLGATVAYGERSLDSSPAGVEDPTTIYTKVGYSWDAFEVAADYTLATDHIVQATDNELTAVGVGGQYNMGNGVSLAGYARQYDMSETAVQSEEINVYGANLRVKF